MKRLHLLVIRSFVGPFILIFFIVLFVLLMQFLWKYIDELVGKGLEITVIAELLLYTSASLIPLALPLSVLMASLMTFGNMGEYNELTAMKASGISLQKIMRPMIIIIILISFSSFYFSNRVLPYTNLKMRALLWDIRKQRPDINIMPGTFYNGIKGYSLRVEDKDPETNSLYGVRLYDHTDKKGNTSVTIAKTGKYRILGDDRYMEFTLYDGHSYTEVIQKKKERSREKTYPHRFDSFDEQVINIELKGFGLNRTDESLFRNHYAMLDIDQLKQMGDSIQSSIDWGRKNLVKTLVRTQYFKKKLPGAARQVKDSLGNKKIIQEFPDSLTNGPPKKKLADAVEMKQVDDSIVMEINPDSLLATPDENELDDLKAEDAKKEPIYLNRDPETYRGLYNKLTLKEKAEVMASALSYARSTRTYISTSSTSLDVKTRNLRKFEIERHRKFTLSIACFLFLLIGAPLGAIIRKGGLGIPLILSALLFIFYYIISLATEKLVRESVLPSYQGMWIPSVLYLITGAFLSYKAATDAAMLNMETYTALIRKYLGIRRSVLLDKIDAEEFRKAPRIIKHNKIITALASFRDTTEENISNVSSSLKFSGFLVSVAGFRESTNIILFERLYKNIMTSICNSDLHDDKAIMNKLYEFPNFKHHRYLDLRWKLYVRLALLLIPPITILVLIRHYIRLMNLKARLKFINQLTTDLIRLLQKHDILDS